MATSVLADFNPMNPRDLDYVPESVRKGMRLRALTETYYLCTQVLGYEQLRPNTHGPLCVFLDTCTARRRMEQMPRSHFKSTIVTIGHRIQSILKNPEVRILIVGDTGTNAEKHLAKIKGHFERNKLLRWLFPEIFWDDVSQAPAWSKSQIYVRSNAVHGEPTIDTVGATGAVVSRHFDIINADDLIGESEYYSETDMDRTIEWFTGLEALFAPPIEKSLMDIPSTFWRTNDVYAYAEKFYGRGQEKIITGPYSYQVGEIAVFRRGCRENGQPIFPEGFTNEYFERLQAENPERYAAQYANDPFSSDVAYFRSEYLQYYNVLCDNDDDGWIGYYQDDDGRRHLIKPENLYITSFCDPAAGGSQRFRSSRAAVITTGVSYQSDKIYLLDVWLRRAPTNQIIDEIFRQNDKWSPQLFSIEANGLQKMLKYWIDERTDRDGRTPIPYVPFIPRGEKDSDRRIKGLQPLFKAQHIWLRRDMLELIEEYNAYPRGTKDGLDCLSQGLQYWNVGFDAVEQERTQEAYERELRRLRNPITGY